jgi:hypothetical protein
MQTPTFCTLLTQVKRDNGQGCALLLTLVSLASTVLIAVTFNCVVRTVIKAPLHIHQIPEAKGLFLKPGRVLQRMHEHGRTTCVLENN